MEYKRRDYFITFTMLGLSAAALMAYQYAGALPVSYTHLTLPTNSRV